MTTNPNPGLLTRDEIVELTGKRRYKAQCRALVRMSLRYVCRPDGSPVVARALVTSMLARYDAQPAHVPPQCDGIVDLAAMRRPRPKR